MNETTTPPCPVCGGEGREASVPGFVGVITCAHIGCVTLRPAAWQNLSRAAALLRACDAFTGRVRVLPDAFAPGYWFAIHTDRQFTSRAPGQTHTDALIALGDLLASPARGEE